MSGLCGFGHEPGVRRLPRPGATGDSGGLPSVPRRRRGWGLPARGGTGCGAERSVSCCVAVRTLASRTLPALFSSARVQRRDFCRRLPGGAAGCGVRPHGPGALSSALVGVQPRTVPGAPCRGAREAAASSRCALRPRRASVVTTAEPARAGSDDAVRRRINGPEIRLVRGFPQFGAKEPKSAGKCPEGEKAVFSRPARKQDPRYPTLCARRNRMPG